MPYKLRKAPKRDLYWVVAEDGQKKSKDPLPRARAEAQMKALYAAMGRKRGGVNIPKDEFVREHEHLLDLLKNPTLEALRREYSTQSKELKKVMKGGALLPDDHKLTEAIPLPTPDREDVALSGEGNIPPRSTLQKLSVESYKTNPATKVDDMVLLENTPTLNFYKAPDNTIVVVIRGSHSAEDWKANSYIPLGQLEHTDRFQKDLGILTNFQSRYSPTQYDYYGVGHSLGGAILDLFLEKGLLKNGVSYNPAVQPQALTNPNLPNDRIYAENDPLYMLGKPFLARKPEVRPVKRSWWGNLVKSIPYLGPIVDKYYGHQLDNFEGGAKAHSKFDKQLRSIGMNPSLYLKEAQRRAKAAGLHYKLLGFADDGDHKLAIPNPSGKIVRFGKVGYNDFLIWKHLKGEADAEKHRSRFQKSHRALKGEWKADPYSPNSLALSVLW